MRCPTLVLSCALLFGGCASRAYQGSVTGIIGGPVVVEHQAYTGRIGRGELVAELGAVIHAGTAIALFTLNPLTGGAYLFGCVLHGIAREKKSPPGREE